jgi:peroxiredoxin
MYESQAISGSAGVPRARTEEVPGRGAYVFAAGICLMIASVFLNVFLAHRLWSLQHLESIKTSERLLKVGTVVAPIVVKRLGGEKEMMSYVGGKPTVLYIFTPPCSWCARNMDNLKTLLDKEGGQYRFIGLSLSEESLSEYVAKNNLKFPVYSGLSPETLKTYKLGSTPQTIVISPEGNVVQDWAGAYFGGQKSEVESFFHVTLPGLRPGS